MMAGCSSRECAMFRRKLELELELTRGQVRDRDQTIQYLRQQIEQDRATIRAWNERAIELAQQNDNVSE